MNVYKSIVEAPDVPYFSGSLGHFDREPRLNRVD